MSFRYRIAGLATSASVLALSSTAALLATTAPAMGATMVATTGTPLTYAIHNPGGEPDGTLQTLDTKPGGFLVDYLSSDILHDNGSSGGFAKISGVGGLGGSGFADLTIDPRDPILGFTAIKFNIIIPSHGSKGQDIPDKTDFDFDTRVYFTGGGFQDFLDTAASPPQRYLVTAGLGETISKIVFSNLDGDYDTGHGKDTVHHTDVGFKFDGIEQVSFDGTFATHGGVPEPATWSMMLTGFFGAGALLRRRRAVLA